MTERTVRFYELVDEDGNQFSDIDYEMLLDSVRKIPESDAYLKVARMELLGTAYEAPPGGARPTAPMIVLDRITRDVRMRIENRRRYRPLELGPGDTLAEPTHYGLFPRNVIGILRTGTHTPGPASLRDFLYRADLLAEPVLIRPLVDLNAVRALRDVETLTKVELEMDPAAAAKTLREGNMFAGVSRVFQKKVKGVTIDVIVKIDPSNHEASDIVMQDLREVVDNREISGELGRAKMNYRRLEDGRADAFDFISESIATSVEVEFSDEEAGPTDRSASEGLMEAYNDLYADIRSALDGVPNVRGN